MKLLTGSPGTTQVMEQEEPRQVTSMKAASWATLVVGGGLAGVFYAYLVSPIIGVLAGMAVELVMLFKMRHWPAFRAAMAETAAYRWEAAHSAFLELERKPLPAGQRRQAQVMLAALESMIGQPQFGEMLVSLAWAFHRRGDDEMARHLLAEAPSRIPRSALENTSPRLASWAKEMAQVWGRGSGQVWGIKI